MEKEDRETSKKKSDVPTKPKRRPTRKKSTTQTKGKGEVAKENASGAQVPEQSPDKPKKLYRVTFFYEWCKTCGLCAALCPKEVILNDENGRPYIDDEDGCIGCRNCEIHCPDFAITVKDRFPARRKTNGVK